MEKLTFSKRDVRMMWASLVIGSAVLFAASFAPELLGWL